MWREVSSKVFWMALILPNCKGLLPMNIAALFCSDSIWFMRYVCYGLHISDAYLSWERTRVVYATIFVFWSASASCILRTPSVLEALLTMCSIWQLHVRFGERWTLRYLKDITLSISAPSIVYVLRITVDRLRPFVSVDLHLPFYAKTFDFL